MDERLLWGYDALEIVLSQHHGEESWSRVLVEDNKIINL